MGHLSVSLCPRPLSLDTEPLPTHPALCAPKAWAKAPSFTWPSGGPAPSTGCVQKRPRHGMDRTRTTGWEALPIGAVRAPPHGGPMGHMAATCEPHPGDISALSLSLPNVTTCLVNPLHTLWLLHDLISQKLMTPRTLSRF